MVWQHTDCNLLFQQASFSCNQRQPPSDQRHRITTQPVKSWLFGGHYLALPEQYTADMSNPRLNSDKLCLPGCKTHVCIARGDCYSLLQQAESGNATQAAMVRSLAITHILPRSDTAKLHDPPVASHEQSSSTPSLLDMWHSVCQRERCTLIGLCCTSNQLSVILPSKRVAVCGYGMHGSTGRTHRLLTVAVFTNVQSRG